MFETMDYIFDKTWKHEYALGYINKTLKKQSKLNRRILTLALTITVYAVLSEMNSLEQKKRIEKLSKEIEELKRPEGE